MSATGYVGEAVGQMEGRAVREGAAGITSDWPRLATHKSPGTSLPKRTLDVSVAAISLLVLSPLLLAIAAVVASTSRGGAIFVQYRIGKDGQPFRLYKFRSMRNGTFEEVMSDPEVRAEYEANGFKLPDGDKRITKIGRLIRKSSLDELPQLWNVVRGEMSLVGIRPLLPTELAERTRSTRLCTAPPAPASRACGR